MPAIESAVAKGFVGLLFSQRTYNLFLRWKLDTLLLEKLRTQVISAQDLWRVVATKLIEDDDGAHQWLEEVRFAILDAEDLMDKISTDILEVQVNRSGTPNTLNEKLRFKGKSVVEKLEYKRKDILRAIHPSKMTREAQMTEIILKLEHLAAQKGHIRLVENAGLIKFMENRVTTSFDNDRRDIIGRSENEKQILELLNSREGMDDALRVISIVGLGGVGKTTLASMVYNRFDTSDAAHSAFQVKAWIYVSYVFDVGQVINSLILQLITGPRDSMATNKDLEVLLKDLKKALQNKRFLLVLDDVWDTIQNKWPTLRNILFSVGAPGSRIIVTTRDPNVAKLVSNCDRPSHELNGLSDDMCWLLFQRHAFENGDSSAYPRLEIIGKKITDKCQGLPLAIKMLGSSLKKNDEKEWNSVLKSKIWNSKTGILPSLWLSYYHLPQAVKECFAYLSMFPKDHILSKEKIILLWVAEGFIKLGESSSDSTNWEHVARTYFEHLHSTFFIQQRDNALSGFVMHDLVHDLAEHVSMGLVVNLKKVNPKSRRLCDIKSERLCNIKSEDEMLFRSAVLQTTALRTLLVGHSAFARYNGLFSKFKLLRVLSIEDCGISKLPDSIGNMKLLKYLNVSGTCIKCLPNSICHLYNLQSLQISDCDSLENLPARLFDHSNLRHLIAEHTPLEQMPDGIGRMKNIQTLSQYVIGEGKSKQMKEFKNLCDLSGKLSVLKLNHVDDPEDVKIAKFENKEYLEELVLEWDEEIEDRDTGLDELVLDAMKPHMNLKDLTIIGYGGEKISNWVVRTSDFFTSIVSLKLNGCSNCKTMPPLGNLTHLKYLSIKWLNCIESLDSGFYGDGENSFKALERLEIRDMEVLKTWYPPRGGFNSLKELSITDCHQLIDITYCFPSLYKLGIMLCNNLVQLKITEGSVPCGDSLKDIRVTMCKELTVIPSSFVNLDIIRIADCPRLVSVPKLHHVQDLVLYNASITFEAALGDYVSEGEGSCITTEVDRMKRPLPLNTLYMLEVALTLTILKSF